MVVLAALSYIVLLMLGIRYAILMALFAALLNVIPYIGIYIATLINMLIAMTTGEVHEGIEVVIVFVIIHIIDANLLMPYIVGNRIKINPLVTLIAVVVGELIWGIPGMFLFIPIAGTMKIIFEKINELRPFALLLGKEEEV
jgi:AI-2 transport protein TqsA